MSVRVENISKPLLRWFARTQRDLPWRREPTPYRVWVSEIMLQQTQVDRVVPYFERFVGRFPDVASLAAAGEDDVLAAWSGLGYYRRGRQLHAAARDIVERHDGEIPRDFDAIIALPGIGRYTAGAVLSIAYNEPVPALDGNVERVLTRLLAIDDDPRRAATRRRLWSEAERLIPADRAREFNQAIMELGAMVCTPSSPDCGRCPIASSCAAARAGDPERYPRRDARARRVDVTLGVLVVTRGRRVLITRCAADAPNAPSYLRGVWNLPALELEGTSDFASELERHLGATWGGELWPPEPIGMARHSITFRRITLRVYRARARTGSRRGSGERGREWRWALEEELGDRFAVPSLVGKALRLHRADARE